VAIILVLVSLSILVFYAQIQGMVSILIHDGYQAAPDSLLGKLFTSMAVNAQSIPESAYINKGLIMLYRLKIALVILAILLLIPASGLTFWLLTIQRFFGWLIETLSPLPVMPEWWWNRLCSWRVLLKVLLAGIILGLVVSIRVVGPLAGVLVCMYFIFKPGRHSLGGMVIYLLSAALALYAAWPYLWSSPLVRFVEVLQHMSRNPKVLPVLFDGLVIPSNQLPMKYLPVMMVITLTWPVWPLFLAGLWALISRLKSTRIEWRSISGIVMWFLLPLIYVLTLRPPMYDGYRHFLFILPPVFILGGLAIQAIWERLQNTWSYALVIIVLVVPGVIGLIKLHPYEYTYYNLLAGETGGAYRRYETDFWLTCYKELMAQVDEKVSSSTTLFVHRQPSIAQEYALPGIIIERFDPEDDQTFSGSLLLLTTRANSDLSLHPEAPEILGVGRQGAKFCLVKDIP
jgi:hypothetical protein